MLTANTHRIGIEIPAGKHRVKLFLDRRPLYASLLGFLAGLMMLPVLARWGGRLLPGAEVRYPPSP